MWTVHVHMHSNTHINTRIHTITHKHALLCTILDLYIHTLEHAHGYLQINLFMCIVDSKKMTKQQVKKHII